MQQLRGSDSFFLYADTPGKHQHISMINIYDQSTAEGGVVRFKTILEHIRERLGTSPIFRQRLVHVPLGLDYPYWIEDPDFDLEYHVRHTALPKPGDWRQFCIQVARMSSRPLDMTRPVWEMYVIEGLDNTGFFPKGSFAIMTKIHHAAVDGVAGAEIAMVMHDLVPRPAKQPFVDMWQAEEPPGLMELAARSSYNNSVRVLQTGSNLMGRVSGLGASAWDMVSSIASKKQPAETKAPITRFSKKLSPHRVWDASFFSLEEIKQIKNSVEGVTVNDVVLTICGGAMREYLYAKDEDPESSLWALVPVSVRKEAAKGQAGNHVILSRTNLETFEESPIERLKAVALDMQKVKRMNAIGADEMTKLQNQLPAATLALATRTAAASFGPGKDFRSRHNMVVTNVPGPQQALYMCGAKLLAMTGMAPLVDQVTMSHVVTSYNGQLVIAPYSDRKILPDPELYTECIIKVFEELKEAAQKLDQ